MEQGSTVKPHPAAVAHEAYCVSEALGGLTEGSPVDGSGVRANLHTKRDQERLQDHLC